MSGFLYIFLILISGQVLAETKTSLSHTVFGTSSEYHSRAFDFVGEIDDGTALIEARRADGYVLHEDFTMNRATIGHKFSFPTGPSLRVGYLTRSYKNSASSAPIMSIKGEHNFSDKLFLNYHFGYVPMSEEFQTAFTVREILRGGLGVLGGSYRWSEYWRSTYYFQHYFFNDGNTRMNHDVGLFYGISRGDPWIWVGLGVSRMTNSKTDQGYWTPLEFYTFGPRFDVSFSFLTRYRFATGLNINYFKDVKTGEGTGYYLNSKFYGRLNKYWEAYTGVESIQSQQFGNVWKSNGISIGIIGIL